MMHGIWQAYWPALLYGLIVDLSCALCRGRGALAGTAAGAFLSIPLFACLYSRNRGKGRREPDGGQGRKAFGLKDGSICIFTGIGLCLAVNTLIRLSPLPGYFTGFSRVSGQLYRPPLLFQAAAMGAVIPAAEELVFRGLGFKVLRQRYSFWGAACLSAAVFGIYHGNVLQAVYGFVMGIVLAWETEKKPTLKAPVLTHMAANLTSVLATAFF